MTRILLATVFVALCFFGKVHSQTYNFSIFPTDSTQFPVPDTNIYNYGDTINFDFQLYHTDSTFFNDSMWVLQRVNNGPVDTVIATFIDSLFQLATYQTNFRDTVIPARYGGINVIVIWPSAPNVIAVDSAVVMEFYVENGVGIEDPLSISRVRIFPNPTTGPAHIEHNFLNRQVLSCDLYDMQGRLLRRMNDIPDKVDVGYLPDGQYLFRITYMGGKAQTFRIIKQQ